MASARDLVRKSGERAQRFLRDDRRLERILHRVTKLESDSNTYSHELIIPMNSTYSPWYDDVEFRSTYDAIRDNSFVDEYKCYDLWEQLGQVAHLDGDILEVGVWRGGTGVLLARRAQQLEMKATTYLADTFTGVAKASDADPVYRGGEHADTSPQIVRDLATRLGVDVEILQGIFPDDTSDAIETNRLRFVHIDVDVYESARQVFEWTWPRLVVGGTVVWDDYGSFSCEGVVRLGRELFSRKSPAVRLIHNLNGHLQAVKLADAPVPTAP